MDNIHWWSQTHDCACVCLYIAGKRKVRKDKTKTMRRMRILQIVNNSQCICICRVHSCDKLLHVIQMYSMAGSASKP